MSAAAGPDRALNDLAEEFLARLRRGEAPDLEVYASAHPRLADQIREVFPALALMEAAKPDPAVRAATTQDAPVPPAIGPYRVVRALGSGGMGRVYEARAPDGARVAVKVLHPHLLGRAGFIERLLREAKAGRSVEHEGVVRTLGAGVVDEGGRTAPYLVLEYVEGRTLRTLLDEAGTFSERLSREIGASVADALAAIHAQGIVHRDVKPENVLLQPDERIKLMDLGVALVKDEALRVTATGEFVGSLLYAAPEQLELGPVDARADLYALGLLLFEVLTGRHPAARRGDVRPVGAASGRAAPSVQAFAPDVSPVLDAVIARLLAFDPARRFATAEEVAVVLREGDRSEWWRSVGGRTGTHRRLPRSAPFHGRADALAALNEAWEDACEGRGQCVMIEGEAGIGKSRLLAVWCERHAGEHGPDITGAWAAQPDGGALPGSSALGPSIIRFVRESSIAAHLAQSHPAAWRLVADSARRQDGDAPDAPAASVIHGACVTLLRAAAALRPLWVVAEDLHFACDEDRELFARLARALHDAPVLLVGTTRPAGEQVAIPDLPAGVRRVPLGALAGPDARALARDVLGADATTADVRELAHRSGGNPFFLFELARARGDGAPSSSDAAVPASVRGLLEARLEGLGEQERRLLDVAACAHDPFDPVLVCEALGTPRLLGLRRIHELDRRHRLLVPEGSLYRFQHHLVAETVREGLPPALRAACHAALGAAIEARLSGRPARGALAHRLAHCFLNGDEPARAAPYAEAALDHLYGTYEYRAAAEMAQRFVNLGSSVSPRVRAYASLALGRCRQTLDPTGSAESALAEAKRIASEAGDAELEARAGLYLGLARRFVGDLDAALTLMEEALRRAETTPDSTLVAFVLSNYAATLAAAGRHELALAAASRALELARRGDEPPLVADTARHLGEIEMEGGRLADATEHLEYAVAVARLHGLRVVEASAQTALGKVALHENRPAAAADLFRTVVATARDLGHARMESVLLLNLALAHQLLDEADAALAAATEGEAIASRMGYGNIRHNALVVRGRARWDRGDLGDAIADLREARSLAGAGLSGVVPHGAFAVVAAWVGDGDEAQRSLDAVRAVCAAAGTSRENGRIALADAEIAEASGDLSRAETALREALGTNGDSRGPEAVAAALRLGMLLAGRGAAAEAEALLARALAAAVESGAAGHEGVARAVVAALRGEDTVSLRVTFEAQASRASAHLRFCAADLLARLTGDAILMRRARDGLARLLATLTPRDRERALRVPLHARVLDPAAATTHARATGRSRGRRPQGR